MTWISTRDSLPTSELAVLIATPDGLEPVWVGYHDGGQWRQIDGSPVEGRVTHWCCFPEPPPSQPNGGNSHSNAHLEVRNNGV